MTSVTGGAARRKLSGRSRFGRATSDRSLFVGVLTVLLATGWAANHFTGLIPAIGMRRHLSEATLDAIFAVYAAGLLPGLLAGGRVSDTLGRPPVVWVGSITTVLGTVAMMFSLRPSVLFSGRLIVGFGVGLAVSACTAWAADLEGPIGAAIAGAMLTTGFAVGPFAAGLIATAEESGIATSFGIAAAMLAAAMVPAVVASRRVRVAPLTPLRGPARSIPSRRGSARALGWAIPLAPWVFSAPALAFVTIPPRMHTGFAGPAVAGTAALITYGVAAVTQLAARIRRWGPHAGSVGALLAGLGYAAAAMAPRSVTPGLGLGLLVTLGCASGLLLREGLIDLEMAAPQHLRGALTGVFYAVTCTGLGLPLMLATVDTGYSRILGVLAILASTAGVSRVARLRRDDHRSEHRRRRRREGLRTRRAQSGQPAP